MPAGVKKTEEKKSGSLRRHGQWNWELILKIRIVFSRA